MSNLQLTSVSAYLMLSCSKGISLWISATTTPIPRPAKRKAVARPRPEAPPVTIAVVAREIAAILMFELEGEQRAEREIVALTVGDWSALVKEHSHWSGVRDKAMALFLNETVFSSCGPFLDDHDRACSPRPTDNEHRAHDLDWRCTILLMTLGTTTISCLR